MARSLVVARALLVVPVALALQACAAARHSSPDRRSLNAPATGRLITAAQIKRSGANDAWEALQRNAPYLATGENKDGQPSRIRRRGASSITLNDAPVVVVDGTRIADFQQLRGIAAYTIATINVLNGIEGTRQYGTGAAGGAIIIATRAGVSSLHDDDPKTAPPR
jgi:outer membrane cobalamin receptor